MKQLTSQQVRQMFLDFFKEKGHRVEPSASLIPQDDPSLLWINSGVATLKKYFDGRIIPENPRIVNAQKSIRTNDIENVGYTARHHTFFEMLGNFSIGDYFKKEAILWAWEFLTSPDWIGFNPDRLSVTVHPEDDEAYDIWLYDVKLPKERIIRLEENFWDIGEGPSGPNTEIFYDRGEEYGNDPNDPELYPGGENERYLEIWNLVFSQFNHNPDDTYTPLPKKNIDTGMGLERMVSILQDVPNNFETDLFMPIIKKTEQFAHVNYGDSNEGDTAFKVIADHIRTVAFAIGDGALPSNEGRGYVLRRLIRRAVRFAKQIGIEKPFMYKLVEVVGEIMESHYPEVSKQHVFIENVIKTEEERFHETLHDGLEILESIIKREKSKGNNIFPGAEVFRLYDTYGFPKELTEEYVAEHDFIIDEEGFHREMEQQRERGRKARQKIDSMHVQDEMLANLKVESSFVGYHQLTVETEVSTIILDHDMYEKAQSGQTVSIILKETPFYAESGGQIADKGFIETPNGKGVVKSVNKLPNGQHLHQITITEGTIQVGDKVQAVVNKKMRQAIIKNHTATHLLHQALKDVLGTHVNQAGSLVEPERLRFDFTHFGAVTEEELLHIERIVNQKIWDAITLKIESMPIAKAKEIGAMALFGEKYGDIVRVVQINDYSIELCGGCHVENTSQIGLFKIIAESGIGAGTRRIEAVTGQKAFEYMDDQIQLLNKTASLLKTQVDQIPSRLEQLFQEMKQLEKENESLHAKLAYSEVSSMLEQVENVEGVNVLTAHVQVKDMNQLRRMIDELKQKLTTGVILLATESNGKVQLAAGVSKDLINKGIHAGKLIKQAAQICEGGGGGRPDMAQAGGKNPNKIPEALAFAKEYIKNNIEE
ncbi:alanyl-tRNA synthetase [Cerasibacillus quisquiliarum]|uniref:Alanine--tRNA ligase n=1 Tax=Cerasibacillus quisquiliarum TaxID=227865 RepID=A0A511UZX9_9BACI|nr:alanine--tRNA ligase [Cerasibacillus quisquiliarum]MBB5145591.1 alanyl-tRNA synthetase [Cerasibacillus quisquiliarum]GEN31013.1 alanine--tRNA ligase [Cerasibacillus quisquiliarum]